MSYIDVLYLGLLLVAFLGFLLLLAALCQTEIPPPDWKAKDLGVGKIPKAPHGPMTTIWAPGD
jgi:hypothetical protein